MKFAHKPIMSVEYKKIMSIKMGIIHCSCNATHKISLKYQKVFRGYININLIRRISWAVKRGESGT